MAALNNINYGFGQDSMQDVFDKTNDAIDRINNYYGEIKVTRFDIGPWDIQSSSFINIDTALSYATYITKIIDVDYLIYNDSGIVEAKNTTSGEPTMIFKASLAYQDNSGQLRIRIDRNGFNDSNHNDAVMNRGYIYVKLDMTL